MGRNSWLDAVKKAFRSPTKQMYTTKMIKAKRREEHQPQEDHDQEDKKRSKRRWIFKKTALDHETTTILHDESINLSNTNHTIPGPGGETNPDKKHAMATTSSFSFEKHNAAALVIQTAFRGYLARRALEALKGVVKLQALVRGHNVRKRAKMTLKCMQALVRVQARLCDQRRKLSNEDTHSNSNKHSISTSSISMNTDEWDGHAYAYRMEEIQAMLNKTQVAAAQKEKDLQLTHAFFHQIPRSGQSEYHGHRELEFEAQDCKWDTRSVKIDTCQRCSLSPSCQRSQNQSYYHQQQISRLNSTPPSYPLHHSPITPSSLSRIKPSVKVHSASPRCQTNLSMPTLRGKPSYMSATESAMARIRPQSAPRQRMSSTTDQGEGEGEKKIMSARKRLSFNHVSNGTHGGVSDSEVDCRNLRSPIHMMERRLSMSSCCKETSEYEINSRERRWLRS